MKKTIILWSLVVLATAELCLIVVQRRALNARPEDRPCGRVITLKKDTPVGTLPDGKIAFTIPRGSRIQESTPVGDYVPIEHGGPEYIIVLRTTSIPKGPTRAGLPNQWIDGYYISNPVK